MSDRPLILIDVDGVLNPFRRPGSEWFTAKCSVGGRSYNVILNPTHGPKLLELAEKVGAELVWATTWEHDANKEIGPKIGLPELPVIEVERDNQHLHLGDAIRHKTPHVADWVKGRPFVWFDDYLTSRDEEYLRGHEGVGDFLIIHVDDGLGITDDDLAEAAAWLADHMAPDEDEPVESCDMSAAPSSPAGERS
ncbi:MAG: HAD domain-containing protein [Gemmatimonadaceae bacterium]